MKIDRQDILLVIGLVSLIGGIASWSKPAAAVVLGLMCLFSVYQIEMGKGSKKGDRS